MSEIKRKAKTKQEMEAARFNGKAHLDKIIPVRLSGEKWAEIKEEASELGLSASVLARMWILDGLRRQKNGFKPE